MESPRTSSWRRHFAEQFDGFSIGSNDLTQLTLGVDRNPEELADLFDEQDEAVKWMISNVIREAHKAGAKIGLCGQAPSDHPEFAEFLVACGVNSISVSPDSSSSRSSARLRRRKPPARTPARAVPHTVHQRDVAVEALRRASASYSGFDGLIGAYPVIRCFKD